MIKQCISEDTGPKERNRQGKQKTMDSSLARRGQLGSPVFTQERHDHWINLVRLIWLWPGVGWPQSRDSKTNAAQGVYDAWFGLAFCAACDWAPLSVWLGAGPRFGKDLYVLPIIRKIPS